MMFPRRSRHRHAQRLWASAIALAIAPSSLAAERVVYGDDNRVDWRVSPSALPIYAQIAQATALLIPKSDVRTIPGNPDSRRLPDITLQRSVNLCPDENFATQPTAGFCSGFLAGGGILVTAGHCVETPLDCSQTAIVFGYEIRSSTAPASVVKSGDVYRCRSIVQHISDPNTGADYTILALDRVVSDRVPLIIRRTGQIRVGESVAAAGHPSGLPLKIATRGTVRPGVNDFYFTSSVDGMSSGSPVFNTVTGVVEGVLVRGEEDFVRDPNGKCVNHKRCGENLCLGEDATATPVFADLIPTP